MKKYLLIPVLLLLCLSEGIAQTIVPGSFVCGENESSGSRYASTGYSAFGGPFTPKGDLKVLIICAGFGPEIDSQWVYDWGSAPDALPGYLTNNTVFYSDNSQFTSVAPSIRNVSAYYHAMSRGQFRLTVDVYPKRINVSTGGKDSWTVLTNKVMEQMKKQDPGFDWSRYDKRTNSPGFQYDNRNTPPDKKPDYVIVVFRYNHDFVKKPTDDSHKMSGYASLSIYGNFLYNNYSFNTDCGFTQVTAVSEIATFQTFIHEVAHTLFRSPHTSYTNGVVGNYFYGENGWGMMDVCFTPFACANAWERWYIDWSDGIKAYGVNADIQSAGSLNATGEYVLRDFITTGDAVRIRLPNGSGPHQHLWLENHQGKSVFDNQVFTVDECNTFPPPPRGVVAMVESVNDDKKNNLSNILNSGANGLKYLHADGNYDHQCPTSPQGGCFWGNKIYNFGRKAANPVGGQNGAQFVKSDFNNNQIIDIDIENNPNDASLLSRQDNVYFNMRDNVYTYENLNKHRAFSAGKELSMSSNPCLINRPLYSKTNGKFDGYYLNGISVSILSYDGNGNAKIKIRFKDTDIDSNTRYAGGDIFLPNITADANPDINLLPGFSLKIDRSATPNRKNKTKWNDFVSPTILYCQSGSLFKQGNSSNATVENNSALVVQSGARYEINTNAQLTVKSGSCLQIKSGGNLTVKGSGKVTIENGAYLCVENGAVVNLQDFNSYINIIEGGKLGSNPDILSSSGCIASASGIPVTGGGAINQPAANVYIQGQSFMSGSNIFTGKNIYAGSNVTTQKPSGAVTVGGTSVVTLDADNETVLDKGFEITKGATLEVK